MANDLNALMRQQAEPTYFTPMAVVKTMVEETDGAAVAQIQPPYEHFFRKVDMKGTFKKTWKILGNLKRLWPSKQDKSSISK